MKLIDIIEYGSSIDQIISGDCRCLDICLIFDKSGLKLDHSKSGYICIPLYKLVEFMMQYFIYLIYIYIYIYIYLNRNRPGKSTKRDRWNFGRSLADGGISLSPKTTLITLIEIIGRAVNTLTPELRKSTLLVENEGLVRLVIRTKDVHTIHFYKYSSIMGLNSRSITNTCLGINDILFRY